MGHILCLDPSGSFHEGKGSTGYAFFIDGKLSSFGEISAEKYDCIEAYWQGIGELLDSYIDIVVCESYKLQPGKAMAQSWSAMETPQVIGFLRMKVWEESGSIWIEQDPSCKTRVTDEILTHMGVFEKRGGKHYCQGLPTNLHMRDAIRHGIYFLRYGVKNVAHPKASQSN